MCNCIFPHSSPQFAITKCNVIDCLTEIMMPTFRQSSLKPQFQYWCSFCKWKRTGQFLVFMEKLKCQVLWSNRMIYWSNLIVHSSYTHWTRICFVWQNTYMHQNDIVFKISVYLKIFIIFTMSVLITDHQEHHIMVYIIYYFACMLFPPPLPPACLSGLESKKYRKSSGIWRKKEKKKHFHHLKWSTAS